MFSKINFCGEHKNATDIFRITSESPFMYYQSINDSESL